METNNNNIKGTRVSLNSVGSLFSDSFKLYQERFAVLSEIVLLPLLIILLGYAFIFVGFPFSILGGLVVLAGIITFVFSTAALVFSIHNNTGVDASYRETTKFFWPIVWMSILSFFAVMGGAVMLILPGIWLAVALSLRNYTVVLENRRGIDSLRQSNDYVKGYWWAVCGRTLLLVIVLALASIIVRIPFTIVAGANGGIVASLILTLFTVPFAMIFYYKIYENLRSLKSELHGEQRSSNTFIKIAAIVGLVIGVIAFIVLVSASVYCAEYGNACNRYMNPPQSNISWQYEPSNQ